MAPSLRVGASTVVSRTSAARGHKPWSKSATSPVIKFACWKRPLMLSDMNGIVFATRTRMSPVSVKARARRRECAGVLSRVRPQRRQRAVRSGKRAPSSWRSPQSRHSTMRVPGVARSCKSCSIRSAGPIVTCYCRGLALAACASILTKFSLDERGANIVIGGITASLPCRTSAVATQYSRKPHRHPGLQPVICRQRIEPQLEAVEIVVADGAGGAPGCEFAQGPDFRDAGVDPAPIVRAERDRLAEREAVHPVFPQSRSKPLRPVRHERHDGLAWRNDFARLGHPNADDAIDRRHQSGLVEPRLQI